MKPETLKREVKKIEWHSIQQDFEMPASQGGLINALLKEYFIGKGKPKVNAVGWNLDIVAVKTKNQIIAWKDTGIGARFLGIINLDGSVEQHPDDTKTTKPMEFKSKKELFPLFICLMESY